MKELSETQRNQLAQVEKKWLNIGLDTSPTDRAAAETRIDELYQEAGRKPPLFKIWYSSPWSGVVAAVLLAYDESWAGQQIRDRLVPQLKRKVQQRIEAENLPERIKNEVARMRARVSIPIESHRNLVWDHVASFWDGSVGTEAWESVASPIWEELRSRIGAHLGDCPRIEASADTVDQGNLCDYGFHDAGWLASYDFFAQLLNWDHCVLTPLMRLAEVCGWWWSFENAVILTEKPREIHYDSDFRLHHPDGPALRYSDGRAVYALHGVKVPEKYILTPADQIDSQEVAQEPNEDVRQVILEKMRNGGV